MGSIKSFTVTIVLEEDGDLIRRLKKSAAARGIHFETALEEAVNIGLWPHISRNLEMADRLRKEYPSTDVSEPRDV